MKTRFALFILILFVADMATAKVVWLKLRKSTPVYKEASFDAPVIAKLKRGQKVRGTDKPKPSGFGYFHKVRLKKKTYGFIPDTAVEGFKKKGRLTKKIKNKTKKRRNSISRGKKNAKLKAKKKLRDSSKKKYKKSQSV